MNNKANIDDILEYLKECKQRTYENDPLNDFKNLIFDHVIKLLEDKFTNNK